jgi:FtsH-binding integral membrane protein
MNIDPITIAYAVLVAALLVWIVSRQFAGRFVRSPRAMLVLPIVLAVVGLQQMLTSATALAGVAEVLVAVELVVAALFGAARGALTRLSLRDGFLFERGGWPVMGLWVLMVAARVAMILPFQHTAVAPALTSSITLSLAATLGAQSLVLFARVRADGRPVRGTSTRERVTLAR